MANLTEDPHRAARLVLALRQQGVMSSPVLKVMEAVDRTDFAPEGAGELAFEDTSIPIGCGQTMLPPAVLAQLLAAVRFDDEAGGRTLIIGTGSGYSTALCADLSEDVVSLERHGNLATAAANRLEGRGVNNAQVLHGDGLGALPVDGPFDRIVLMGTIDTVPMSLVKALSPKGRLSAPVMHDGHARIEIHTHDGVETGPSLDRALTPLRPGVAHLL